ncbi:unnamed protein product [Blepharisma stoltei]|uniref:Uncharacterized protein n=1 Tax=Blepharisma stoltei TaxID=1481888 RepID=A0AAU9K9Z4_9CILI|nr:unnamed protein product [Blepharisma stoltei]
MIIVQGTLVTLQALKLGIWVSLLVGVLTLGCACDEIIPSFAVSIIPFIIALTIVPILIHVFLNFLSQGANLFAKPILLFWAYAISVSLIVFTILGSLSLDGVLNLSLTIVFSPLWFALACFFLFSVFIAEVLVENDYKRVSVLLFTWTIALYIFSFMWMGHITNKSPGIFAFVLTPIYVANLIHIIMYVNELVNMKRTLGTVNINTQELLCILMLPCFAALLMVKIYTAPWIPALTLVGQFAAVLIFCFYKDAQSIWVRNDNKNSYETIS